MNGSYPSPCSHITLLIINVAMSRFVVAIKEKGKSAILGMIEAIDHIDRKDKTKKYKKVTMV